MRRWIVLGLVLIVGCSPAVSATTTSLAVEASSTTTLPVPSTAPPDTVPNIGDGQPPVDPTGEVFVVTDLARFRSSTELVLSRDEAGTDVIISSSVAASYVKNPDAIEAMVTSDERVVKVVGIDGTYWIDDGTGWQENPVAEQVLALTSVTALTPDTLTPILARLTDIGTEDVNGRPAVHYQGGVSDVAAWLGGSPELDQFAQLKTGSIDVWIDAAGFVSKAAYVFGGTRINSSATEFYRATFELFDFDGDFEIVPPL